MKHFWKTLAAVLVIGITAKAQVQPDGSILIPTPPPINIAPVNAPLVWSASAFFGAPALTIVIREPTWVPARKLPLMVKGDCRGINLHWDGNICYTAPILVETNGDQTMYGEGGVSVVVKNNGNEEIYFNKNGFITGHSLRDNSGNVIDYDSSGKIVGRCGGKPYSCYKTDQ